MALPLRQFGTEITGNRQAGHELTPTARAAIAVACAAGEKKTSVAHAFYVHRNTVNRTLKRWHQYYQWNSLPRSGRPDALSYR